MIMTRWHLDDPVGRWLEHFPNTKMLRYPAIAEQDERWRKKGEPLFPELKSLEFLNARQKVLTQASWESIYQQRPIAAGGDMFPVDRFKVIASVDRSNIKRSVRYIDKAGTEDGGAYTAAVLVHDMKDGTTVVEDVLRGQWSALEREARLMQCATADMAICPRYQVWVEQEPGSGGKESAENTIRLMKGCDVHADKVTGEKTIRAEPYAAQVQAGQVSIKAADWTRDFLSEHEVYPMGKYKDQVDAAAKPPTGPATSFPSMKSTRWENIKTKLTQRLEPSTSWPRRLAHTDEIWIGWVRLQVVPAFCFECVHGVDRRRQIDAGLR